MARIYLVGFMGAGKTTVGKQLAEKFGYTSLDLDDAFEEKYKINIKTFFHKYDENLFRNLEVNLLASTFEMENVIISTGGGTPAFFNSIDKMNEHGLTIYLKMTVAGLVERLQKAKRPRPLIKSKNTKSLTEFITQKLSERMIFYERAQLIVDADNIDVDGLYNQINELL